MKQQTRKGKQKTFTSHSSAVTLCPRFEKMVRSTGKLNPTSKKTVMELLEKAREKLPPKPEKKKASPPVAAVAPVAVDVGPPQAKSAWMQEDASPVSI